MHFKYFVIISSLRRAWPLIENKNLEPSSPKNALCQVWLKMAQWFWRRRFLKVFNLFLLFPHYLPFGKDVAFHLNKLESPLPKNALCQVWLKLVKWFCRKRFLKVVNLFFIITQSSHGCIQTVEFRPLGHRHAF